MMSPNGRLDTRTLTKVDGWAYLASNTAAAWNAACDEMVALGHARPAITAPDGAYRTFDQQVYWKVYWKARGKPGNASTPGYSSHGWGTAVDIHRVDKFPRSVLRDVFARYGFTFNVASEPWHMHHNGVRPAVADSTPIDLIRKQDQMYIVHQVIDGVGSYLVNSAGVRGITGEQEEVLHRVLGRPDPAFVPLAGSEITELDNLLRANARANG